MSKDGRFPQSYEVQEMIFMHLPGELRKLRKVCKRFYHVINSSMPLMNRIIVKWHTFSESRFWGDNHKFYNVELDVWLEENVSEMMDFLEIHAKTLRNVTLRVPSDVVPDVHQILLKLSESVEDLTFDFRCPCVLEPPVIRMNKLRSLTLMPQSLDAFTKCEESFGVIAENLRLFTYEGFNDAITEKELPTLMKYLRNQPQLEEIYLARLAARDFLRESDEDPFPFRLKKASFDFNPKYDTENIQMDYPYDDRFTIPFIPQFIELQQKTLRHLSLEHVVLTDNEIAAILTSELKTVELLSVELQCFENSEILNTTIESLVLGDQVDLKQYRAYGLPSDMLYCFFENCRGLKSLEVKHKALDWWWSMVLADMETLTQLKLHKCEFKPMPLASVERLEVFTRSGYAEDWVSGFIRMNPSLKIVNVPKKFEENELFQAVTDNVVVEYNLNGERYKDEDDGIFIVERPEPDE